MDKLKAQVEAAVAEKRALEKSHRALESDLISTARANLALKCDTSLLRARLVEAEADAARWRRLHVGKDRSDAFYTKT